MSKRLTITLPDWLMDSLRVEADRTSITVCEAFRRRFGVPKGVSSGTNPILRHEGPRVIRVIKALKDYTGLSLKESYDFIRSTPVPLSQLQEMAPGKTLDLPWLAEVLRSHGAVVDL